MRRLKLSVSLSVFLSKLNKLKSYEFNGGTLKVIFLTFCKQKTENKEQG